MKITSNTTPQEVWAYHLELLAPFLDMIQSGEIPDPNGLLKPIVLLQVHVDRQAKHYADDSYRQGIQLKGAESRIAELEREVAKLRHYQEIVEQALADADLPGSGP